MQVSLGGKRIITMKHACQLNEGIWTNQSEGRGEQKMNKSKTCDPPNRNTQFFSYAIASLAIFLE